MTNPHEDDPMRRCPLPRTLLLSALWLFAAHTAFAAGGQLEISQTCALAGCFPGDAPGFPVTISASGSYRLTSNLSQSFLPPVSGPTNAIEIQSGDVDLDLGGFVISCTAPLTPDETCSGTGSGVFATLSGDRNIRVANGSITRMPDSGVDLGTADSTQVESLRVVSNGADGVSVGSDSIVSGVVARGNLDGIRANTSSLVKDSVASRNLRDGIVVTFGVLVTGNVLSTNLEYGVRASTGFLGSALRDNMFFANTLGSTIGNLTDVGGNSGLP